MRKQLALTILCIIGLIATSQAQTGTLSGRILDENKLGLPGANIYFEALNKDNYVAGRSDNNILIRVKGSEELLGEFRDVKITSYGRTILTGEIIA